MLQIPPSVALKARSRQSQLHNNYSNDKNNNDGEEPEEEFRILQYPAEPWGRASRSRTTAIIPSRRIISSLIEDISQPTVSQDWTDTARSRRTRHASNTKRVALLKRARSSSIASVNNATESSDSGSTFNTRKSTTSSAKKRPAKQLRSGPPSLSDNLNTTTTTTTTTATTYLTPKKPTLPRKPPRPRHTETPPSLQDDHVEVLVVDDEDDKEEVVVVDEEDETTAVANYGGNTSESDYSPGKVTMTQRQRQQERKARPRRRGLLQHDEGQGQAVKQIQELEEVHQEVNRVAELSKVDGSNRAVERMDCVVIPLVDHPEKSTAVRSTKKGPQLSLRTDTGKITKKDSKQEPGLKTRAATTKDTMLTNQSPTKATTTNGARPAPRRTIEIAPVIDMNLDTPRQTRSDARNNPTTTPESTKTVLPVNARIPVQEHQSSSQQPSKAVGPSSQPSSTQVRAKDFHGWWLKRKENLAQDGNLGIVVQGNMIEPKVMTWHTSTIKDAPEPTLVMTFTGSFYRLYGSIDVQKMEGNGFSKDMINAFRNGFPANWKTILGKEYGKQAASTASMANERPMDKRVDTTGQNDHSALKRREIPSTQQPRESVQRGKPVVQQGKPQLRQATQEKRMVIGITPEVDSPRMIGKAPRGPAVAPVERAPVQVKSWSLSSQGSILGPPTSRTLNKDEAVEIVTPVASSKSLTKGSAVSKATTRTNNNKPRSSPSSSRKRSALTSAAPPAPSPISTQPVSTWAEVLEEVTARGQSPTPRRASVPKCAPLREDMPAQRRSSAPDQLITTMGTWKAVGPTAYGVDKLLDKALDGNLRMRSKAVVEQIRERTRQRLLGKDDNWRRLGDDAVANVDL
ncbi:hypothetical protein EC957_003905 [Mortierella hygrophila]|uniref:SANTA domain-containing protein n=1 Tax=Mortierella hygrophila TaxID=979708 RepID=A0A9P6F2U1_9FUNG|nr:hypothetical protein EC957_003905 [Mortierella hygrophila]